MTKTILLATTAILLTAGVAAAQAPAAAPGEAASQGALVFTPDFFAEQRPNTALDMVSRVPGFDLNDGDGSRGFEGSVGNVLINGARPASKSDTGSNVLGRTPASQVERIELIRGGAPGIAMQGYAVVVNVILKREATSQSIVTWNANLIEGAQDIYGATWQFTARDGDRSWGFTVADGLGMSDSNGPGRVVRRNAAGVITRDEAVDSVAFGGGNAARLNYSGPLWGGKIEATTRYGGGDFQQEQVQTSATARRENLSSNDDRNGELGVTFRRPIVGTWSFEGRFIHNFEDFEGASTNRTTLNGVPSPEQVFSYEGSSSETIGRMLFRNERSTSLTFETGAELAYNMLDTRQAFTVGGVPVVLPSASVKVEELRGEAFGKTTWRMSPTLSLEGGLRFETSTISQSGDASLEKTLFFPKPRFLVTWTPSEGNQVRFRFEREVGQLDFGDFAASSDLQDDNVYGGNVDLEPEQRWISELVYERRFWGEGVVSATLRHDQIEDVLDRIPLPGDLSATGNIGDATRDSAVLSLTLPTSRLGISGGRLTTTATFQQSEVTDPTTGKSREISGIRPFDMNIGFTQDIASWKTQWGFEWLRGFDEETFDPDQTTDVRLRNYRVIFAEYKPTPSLSLRAQVNIWDDFRITRTAYADRSAGRPVDYVETREVDPRTFWQLRLRKTF